MSDDDPFGSRGFAGIVRNAPGRSTLDHFDPLHHHQEEEPQEHHVSPRAPSRVMQEMTQSRFTRRRTHRLLKKAGTRRGINRIL